MDGQAHVARVGKTIKTALAAARSEGWWHHTVEVNNSISLSGISGRFWLIYDPILVIQ